MTADRQSLSGRFSGQGAKIWGIFGLLVAICVYTAFSSDQFLPRRATSKTCVHRTALFGILSIGAAFVIITGGIDLSIGSLVCLVGVLLPYLADSSTTGPSRLAVAAVMGMAVAIGMIHGLLITKNAAAAIRRHACADCCFIAALRAASPATCRKASVLDFKELRSIATERLADFRLRARTCFICRPPR